MEKVKELLPPAVVSFAADITGFGQTMTASRWGARARGVS
jgi:hypothetical protein